MENFPHGLGHVGHDLEKMKILRADVSELEKMVGEKLHPGFPVGAARPIEQDDGNDARLARLHQRQHFEAFIHRAEASGEEREGVRFFYEIEFAREEIIEIDQLRIAFDDRIRALLEWQTNIETEAVLASRAFLSRTHDAVATTGNDHVIFRDHFAREFFGDFVLRLARRRPGRAEDTDFAERAVSGKNFRGVTHFFQRPIHQLQVARAHFVARHLERGDDELFD